MELSELMIKHKLVLETKRNIFELFVVNFKKYKLILSIITWFVKNFYYYTLKEGKYLSLFSLVHY